MSHPDPFKEYWRNRYGNCMSSSCPQREVRAICYDAWPLIFNYVMMFFERYIARKMLQVSFRNLSEKKVLDIGCGMGRWARLFRNYGATVIGTDLFEEVLRDDVKRLPGIRFCAGEAAYLSFKNESFDYVSVMTVFQHLPYEGKESALREMRRVLKKDGEVLVLERLTEKSFSDGEVSCLSASEWANMFKDAGFELKDMRGLHAYPIVRHYDLFKKAIGKGLKLLKRRSALKSDGTDRAAGMDQKETGNGISKKEHLYQFLDTTMLKIVACVSFPLEFLCADFGNHCMFLLKKGT